LSNVFQPSMVKLQVPRGFSRSISIAGFTVDADTNGHVVVPANLKRQLIDHGLTEVPMESDPPELEEVDEEVKTASKSKRGR